MSLIFAVEPLGSIWEEKIKCAQEHWKETTMGQSGEILDAKFDRYEQYEKLGWYVEIVARHESVMVGFCGMYLVPSMHTQEMLATEDILYIKPEFRHGRNALRFYLFVEEEMKRRGAKKIMLTAPVDSVANKLLLRTGCEHSANMYSKMLDT